MAEQNGSRPGDPPDYLRCPTGSAHVWTYRGKPSQIYACSLCAITVSKTKLQEVSNAQLHG